ncbi:murein hydrolase activator EnvC family protein [Methylomonas sp. MgM2]
MKFGICVIFAAIGFGSDVWAEADANKGLRELSKMHAKIKRIGNDVKQLAAEKSEQVDSLRKLEKQYGDQINALNKVKAEIAQQEQMLQQVRSKIDATRMSLQAEQRNLESLVRTAYVMGDKRGLDVLLNQHDPGLSGRMLVYYNYIGQARVRKLQSIEDSVQTLKRLESQKDTETQLLQVSLEKKQQELQALKELKVQRENLLAKLDKEYASKKIQLAGLIEDEKKLEALVVSLQREGEKSRRPVQPEQVIETKPAFSNPIAPQEHRKELKERKQEVRTGKVFAELQGHLPWPVAGAVIEHFGNRRFETRWDGAVIGAKEGADIRVVADGRVVFADWLRGYGLMTIVDHGKGYMSLYAFNQSLHKRVGEYVRAGEILASVGRSGGRSQAALYFGIRVKGRAVDPEKWCRKLGKS